MTKPTIAVRTLGQSIWLDQISRDLLRSGDFERLVREDGVAGVTSNPSIFEKAIGAGDAYDEQLRDAGGQGRRVDDIFDALAQADLRAAADVLRPYWEQTGGADGFVSWEVSPELAFETETTLADARRLWGLLDRPNAMIKIPGTAAGLDAIEESLFDGVNINITLLFAVARYEQVMERYLRALERRLDAGRPLASIHSVASFFVSRVDTAVDKLLDARAAGDPSFPLADLRSQAAIANAKVAYRRYQETFSGPRWQRLADAGAHVQRPLWASTSTKDPSLPDTYYVDSLIGPDTVNTLPLPTLHAFNDHGMVSASIEQGHEHAESVLRQLAEAGVDLTAVTDQLEAEGVRSFAQSFVALRKTLSEKTGLVQART